MYVCIYIYIYIYIYISSPVSSELAGLPRRAAAAPLRTLIMPRTGAGLPARPAPAADPCGLQAFRNHGKPSNAEDPHPTPHLQACIESELSHHVGNVSAFLEWVWGGLLESIPGWEYSPEAYSQSRNRLLESIPGWEYSPEAYSQSRNRLLESIPGWEYSPEAYSQSRNRLLESIPGWEYSPEAYPQSRNRLLESIPGWEYSPEAYPQSRNRLLESIPGWEHSAAQRSLAWLPGSLACPPPARLGPRATAGTRKGTNGVSTNGVTAFFNVLCNL